MKESSSPNEEFSRLNELQNKFSMCLEELYEAFYCKGSDYFFTEKEIHAYLYHICQSSNEFVYGKHFLVHSEYPTPFKCKKHAKKSEYSVVAHSEKYQRGHIDLILINPNFIQWVDENKYGSEIIYGLGGKNFETYMPEFEKKYLNFFNEKKEPLILNAVEFKFFRHSYDGTSNPINEIRLDISKLHILKSYKIKDSSVNFVDRVNSVVFVGNRHNTLREQLEKIDFNCEFLKIMFPKIE